LSPHIVRHSNEAPSHDGTVLSVSREEAGWKYVSFRVWRLEAGQTVDDQTAHEEVGLVVLSGWVDVRSPDHAWEDIGKRSSIFEGSPFVVYLPPATRFSVTARTDCEIARAGALAPRGEKAYLITPDEIGEETRGEDNALRRIRHLLDADRPAEHLFLGETITPNGNWSSYPPHKHDTEEPPRETYLEEVYYHRMHPRQGFGFQYVYTPDRELDEAVVIRDGTLVLVPRGYHPAVVAPGYDLYYLNVMAGPVREWHFTEDPDHAWVAQGWRPYSAPK
jgi:5-deoxy-glucuronate isomerase